MKPLEISFVILTIVVFFTMNLCLFFARANKLESDTKVRVLRELRELKSEDLHRTDDETVEQAWRLFQQKASNWSHTFVDFVNPLAKKILNGTSVSRQCSQSLFHLLAAFGKLETWAVEMIDAWGKFPPAGILDGTYCDLGSYDQCLNARIASEKDVETSDEDGVLPQYCTLQFRMALPKRPFYHNILHPLEVFVNSTKNLDKKQVFVELAKKAHFMYYMPLRLGICLPTSCSLRELNQIADKVGEKMVMRGEVVKCENRREEARRARLTTGQINAILLLAVIGSFSIVGTVTDLLSTKKSTSDSWKQYLIAFSLPRNIKSLLNTDTAQTDVRSLHGLRVLMMAWIIMGHSFLWINFSAFGRSFDVTKLITPFWIQGLFHVNIAVDAFFFMSGLLTTFATWRITKGDIRKFSIFGYLTARLFRLTPTYAFVIAATFLLPLLSSGPLWHETVDPVIESCKENWWTNLVYLHNFIDTRNICLLHTWYLSNDVQFHVLGLFIVIALMKRPAIGMALNASIVALFTGVAFFLTFFNHYPPHSITTQPELDDRLYWVYDYKFKPWVHIGAFCVGLVVGYHLGKNNIPKLSKVQRLCGWTLTALTMFGISYGIYDWNNGGSYTPYSAALYSSTHRTFWAFALSWIVMSCAAGQGGFINAFLSWKGLIPLSRITYTVYLTHGWFVWYYVGSLRQRIDASHYTMVSTFVSHWLMCNIFSFFFALLYESPFLVLQKQLLARVRGDTGVLNETDKAKVPKFSVPENFNNTNNHNNNHVRNGNGRNSHEMTPMIA